jgi:ABC-type cobalamin/Fe3+-siderophores transport system ATPase subunit
MITIEQGQYPIWQGFSLHLPADIRFEPGMNYRLDGPNGSGKSSFIHQVLLAKIRKRQDLHIICLEQQMYMQLYALRAWAAVCHPGKKIVDEADVWNLLWEDLAGIADTKPVVIISDEAHRIAIPEGLKRPHCLIYSSHSYTVAGSLALQFVPQTDTQSEVLLRQAQGREEI